MRAPAGYGKTTLVAAAAAELGWQCVWYRLDRLDADPDSFLRSLASAVRLRAPSLPEPQHDSASPGANGESATLAALASELIEELMHVDAGPEYIILDDYDAVEPRERFDAAISAILRLLPPTVHLVVLCRRRPAFATAKLVLEGGLGEISYRDLLLDQGQTAQAFERLSGAAPTPAALEELRELTGGWAAGVVLAGKAARWADPERLAESLDDRALERLVFPYLAAEVYEAQPAEVREFLRQTCCPESMTLALVELVTGSAAARRLLEDLQERELFAFTGPSGAVRYHPLFRRFLERELIREEGAGAHRALQRRSADALVTCGLVAQAVELYLELGELPTTLALLQSRGAGLLDECGDALLQRWVDALRTAPEADPSWASLIQGRRLFRRGHLASAREQLESAHAALRGDADGRYMTYRALARHHYLTGADEDAIRCARRALDAATGRRQEAESLATLAQTLSVTCRWQELEETLAAFDAVGDAPPRLAAEVAYLEVQRTYMTVDAHGALSAAERALPLVARSSTKEEYGSLLNAHATLSLVLGLYEKSAQHLDQARRACAAHRLRKAAAEVRLTEAALLAHGDQLDRALEELDQLLEGDDYARDNAALLFEVQALRGTMLRRAGRLGEAEEAYEIALGAVETAGPLYDRLSAELDLAFTRQWRRRDREVASQMQHLMDEAAHARLLSVYAKARLYLAIISSYGEREPGEDLGSPCEELLRLGHRDLLGQELLTYPRAAEALLTADIEERSLIDVLGAIGCQTRGPDLLASLAFSSDRAGLLVVEAARLRLSAEGRSRMLTELRRHPSKRVRDRARHGLLAGSEGRLFPELSPREEEVLAALAGGGTNQEIAKQLSLTLATVKTHVHRILAKIEVRGRLAAAVAYRQRAASRRGRSVDGASR